MTRSRTFVEEMAARYARDPNSVDASWRAFFDQVRDDPAAVAAADDDEGAIRLLASLSAAIASTVPASGRASWPRWG